MKQTRREFLKILAGLTALACINIDTYIPPELAVDYWLGRGKKYQEFNKANLPGLLGIGKRVDEPFDDLTNEETQYVYDVNEAVKRTVEELGLSQRKTIFYPIRDSFDRIPDCRRFETWIDVNVGIDPTYPEMGYQGMTLFNGKSDCPRVYATSKFLYPDPAKLGDKYFPALMWEISNTFGYLEHSSEQLDIADTIRKHYEDILKNETN